MSPIDPGRALHDMTDGNGDFHGDDEPRDRRSGRGSVAGALSRVERALPRVERTLPRVGTSLDADRAALALTVGLLVALAAFVPAFGAAVDLLGLPIPVPLLVGVGVAVGSYGVAVLALRRWVVGAAAGLVVLATFKANVPVLPVAHQFPGDVVADLLLVHAPLAALAVVAVRLGWLRRSPALPAVAFAGFVAATLLPPIVGRSPSPFAAASFSLYALFALLAFVACVRVVAEGVLSFRTVVSMVLLAVCAHAAVGLLQLAHGGPFGFTRLGEGGGVHAAAIRLPALGDVSLGTYVSGFTGMAFVLAYLVVLVLPAGLVLVARLSGWRRYLGAGSLVAPVVVLRGSSSDTARGAALVALAAFVGLLAIRYRPQIAARLGRLVDGRVGRLRGTVAAAAYGALLVAVVALPSSDAGRQSRTPTRSADAAGSGIGASGGGGGIGGGGVDAGAGSVGVDPGGLSVPLFDLTNLGVRLQQYAVALDVFARFPVVGLGGVNYVLVAGEYGMTAPPGQNYPYPVHSLYFTLLAETGALGTALYLAAVAGVLFAGWRLLGRSDADGPLAIGVLAGLVGALAFSTFDVLVLYTGPGFFPFWIVAGALVGEARRHDAVLSVPVHGLRGP